MTFERDLRAIAFRKLSPTDSVCAVSKGEAFMATMKESEHHSIVLGAPISLVVLVLVLVLAAVGHAQTGAISDGLYSTFGSGGRVTAAGETALADFQRISNIEEAIRWRLGSARYRWGAVLVTPIFGLPTIAVDANCSAGAVSGVAPEGDKEPRSG